jgi:hypothetical protein
MAMIEAVRAGETDRLIGLTLRHLAIPISD